MSNPKPANLHRPRGEPLKAAHLGGEGATVGAAFNSLSWRTPLVYFRGPSEGQDLVRAAWIDR
jgi:hypothetical protein